MYDNYYFHIYEHIEKYTYMYEKWYGPSKKNAKSISYDIINTLFHTQYRHADVPPVCPLCNNTSTI